MFSEMNTLDWPSEPPYREIVHLLTFFALANVQAFYGPQYPTAISYDVLIRQDRDGFQLAEAIVYTRPSFTEHKVLVQSRSKEAKSAIEGLWYQIQRHMIIGIPSKSFSKVKHSRKSTLEESDSL